MEGSRSCSDCEGEEGLMNLLKARVVWGMYSWSATPDCSPSTRKMTLGTRKTCWPLKWPPGVTEYTGSWIVMTGSCSITGGLTSGSFGRGTVTAGGDFRITDTGNVLLIACGVVSYVECFREAGIFLLRGAPSVGIPTSMSSWANSAARFSYNTKTEVQEKYKRKLKSTEQKNFTPVPQSYLEELSVVADPNVR